jgi:hypothetical protein
MANLCKFEDKAAATAVALMQISFKLPIYEQGGAGWETVKGSHKLGDGADVALKSSHLFL